MIFVPHLRASTVSEENSKRSKTMQVNSFAGGVGRHGFLSAKVGTVAKLRLRAMGNSGRFIFTLLIAMFSPPALRTPNWHTNHTVLFLRVSVNTETRGQSPEELGAIRSSASRKSGSGFRIRTSSRSPTPSTPSAGPSRRGLMCA